MHAGQRLVVVEEMLRLSRVLRHAPEFDDVAHAIVPDRQSLEQAQVDRATANIEPADLLEVDDNGIRCAARCGRDGFGEAIGCADRW